MLRCWNEELSKRFSLLLPCHQRIRGYYSKGKHSVRRRQLSEETNGCGAVAQHWLLTCLTSTLFSIVSILRRTSSPRVNIRRLLWSTTINIRSKIRLSSNRAIDTRNIMSAKSHRPTTSTTNLLSNIITGINSPLKRRIPPLQNALNNPHASAVNILHGGIKAALVRPK